MKPALHLRLNQQLALTPQLQQAIRLLQLSSIELETELREALESNPLLEMGDEVTESEAAAEPDPAESYAPAPTTVDTRSEPVQENASDYDSATTYDSDPDFGLEHTTYGTATSEHGDSMESQDEDTEDLRDHLLWQLNLTPFSPRDRAIGATIIESINDDGYLTESAEALQESLAALYRVNLDEIESVRHRIQQFDPLSVGSRNLSECLRVQLDAFDPDTAGHALAHSLVSQHLEALAKNDREKLCRQLRASTDELDVAIALIRSLDPKPGSRFSTHSTEYATPDAYVTKSQGGWTVNLSAHLQPKLGINQHYASLIARAQRDDANYLRGHLQEARWLIKSLQTRAETVLKVANAIVRAQCSFLEYGPEAMRPLVLKDIAEEIGMHESTISRVTTRKYLHTPRGTYEFKYFFSSHVGTADGGTASATAIHAMIRKLVDEESSSKPLSDQALTAELNKRGINVARRTVAKYREAMHIPSSNDRSRLS